jgi:hypothetical protein
MKKPLSLISQRVVVCLTVVISLTVIIGLMLAMLAPGAARADNAAPVRIRAVIDAKTDQTLAVTARTGEKLTLTLTGDTKISSIAKASIDDIKSGSFIGTAAVAQNGQALRALEVHIFPESMRGTGEGHRPWDSGNGGNSQGDSMTNGTVSQMSGDVVANGGRSITVTYKGGQQQVEITPNTPIVSIGRGDRSLLQPGAHIIAFASKYSDGSLLVERLLVGKDGITPPM